MSAKVLLVDDSGLARRSTRRILEGAGYLVVEAEDGLSALEQYLGREAGRGAARPRHEGMYGLEVLTKLRELDPTARVIIVIRRHPDIVAGYGGGGRCRGLHQQANRGRADPRDGRADGETRCRVELTQVQQDALIELLNIGFGRAAASLSQLTGHRVVLEVPGGFRPSDLGVELRAARGGR